MSDEPSPRRLGRSRRKAYGAEARMPLIEHILELRNRAAISLAAIAIGAVAMWFFFNPVWDFLKQPYCDLPQSHQLSGDECTLVVTGVFEGFLLRLKVSLILGIVVSCPIWLYQIWAFITPAMRHNEKKWTFTFLGIAVPLFLAGATLSYFTLEQGLAFLLGVNPNDVLALVSVSSYLGYMLAMLLIFGVSFEFPLVVILLNFMGVLSYERMRSWWRGVVLGIFIFAAAATPSADPITMSVLAVALCLLFWMAAGVAKVHDRRKAKREATGPYAGLSDDEASPLEPAW